MKKKKQLINYKNKNYEKIITKNNKEDTIKVKYENLEN